MDMQEKGTFLTVQTVTGNRHPNGTFGFEIPTIEDIRPKNPSYWVMPVSGDAEKHAKWRKVSETGNISAAPKSGNGGDDGVTDWTAEIQLDGAFLEDGEAAANLNYSASINRSFSSNLKKLEGSKSRKVTYYNKNGHIVVRCTSPTYEEDLFEVKGAQVLDIMNQPWGYSPLFNLWKGPDSFGAYKSYFHAIPASEGTLSYTKNGEYSPTYNNAPPTAHPSSDDFAPVENDFTCADVTWTYDKGNSEGAAPNASHPYWFDSATATWAAGAVTLPVVGDFDPSNNSGQYDNPDGERVITFDEMVTPVELSDELADRNVAKAFGVLGSNSWGAYTQGNTKVILGNTYSLVTAIDFKWRYDGGTTHENWIDAGFALERQVRFGVPAGHISNGGTYYKIEYEIATVTRSLDPNDPAEVVDVLTPTTVEWAGDPVLPFTEWITLPTTPDDSLYWVGIRALRDKPTTHSAWVTITP